jgi:hypothetical protein
VLHNIVYLSSADILQYESMLQFEYKIRVDMLLCFQGALVTQVQAIEYLFQSKRAERTYLCPEVSN